MNAPSRCIVAPGAVEFSSAQPSGQVPCTPAQRGVWHALDDPALPPSSRVHARWLHLSGDVDRAALAGALRDLVARHDALRASFTDDGRAMRFLPQRDIELQYRDLRPLPPAEREPALAAAADPSRQPPFDLLDGPLLRACLLQVGDADHRLLLTLHRMICDPRALQVLLVELGALYARQLGQAPDALGLPGSFAEFARGCAGRPLDEPAQRYWLAQLEPGPARRHPAAQPPRDRRASSRRLDPALVRAFDEVVRRAGARRKSGWLALLAALLAQGGRRPVLIASEADDAADSWPVGMCAAVLPLRLPIEPEHGFAAALVAVDRVLVTAEQQRAPDVDDLLGRLSLPADLRWPIAPVLLRLRDSSAMPTTFGPLSARCADAQCDSAEFALDVTIELDPSGPRLDWRGHTRVASRVQLERFLALLRAVVIDQQISLKQALATLPAFEFTLPRAPDAANATELPRQAPLSPDQAACWFASRRADARVARHAIAHRLRGTLEPLPLRTALARLLQRQQVLRLRFEAQADGRWLQRLQDAERVLRRFERALQVPEDLSRLADNERETVLQERLRALADAGFPDDGSQLFRLALFRLGPAEHVLLQVAHAALLDAASLPLISRELGELYRAARDGAPAQLPELPIEPIEYARWHAAWLHGADYADARDEWRQRLAGAAAVAPLPNDRLDGTEATAAVHREPLQLPGWLGDALRQVAHAADAGLDAALLAAFAVWLARCSGGRHACIAVAGRAAAGDPLQHLAGPFGARMTVATALFDGAHGHGFNAVIGQCRDLLAELRGLPRLQQDDLRLLCATPVQAHFGFRDLSDLPSQWGELQQELVVLPPSADENAFALAIDALPDRIVGWLSAPADRHLPASVALFRDQFIGLLVAVAAQPQARIDHLWQPAAPERDRLQGWSIGPDVGEVGADALTARFRRICAQQPQAPAVVVGGRTCSYRQLARAVGNAAVQMRAAIARDDVLAIALPAGVERIAGVLAGLSVSARCLLLDPAAPPIALRRWLDRCLVDGGGARHRRWLLAEPALARALRWPAERMVDPALFEHDADIRGELLRAPCCSGLLLPVGAGPTARAMPLGERSLLALAHGLREWSLFGPGVRVGAGAAPDSAAHLVETILPLIEGGCVQIAERPTRFADWLAAAADGAADTAPNLLLATPADWQRAVAGGWRGRDGLTVIVDECPEPLPAGARPIEPSGRHFRAFGRGPAGVWSLFGPFDAALRVLPGRRIEVVDAHGDWLPVGVFGDLRLSADSHDGAAPLAIDAGRARWRADGVLERHADPPPVVRSGEPPDAAAGPAGYSPALPGDAAVVALRRGDGRPLWLLHGDDGELGQWDALLRHGPARLPVFGLRATVAAASLRTRAALYADALLAVQPDGPYRLAGAAIGGLLAIELADLLQQRGAEVQQLVLFGAAPRAPERLSATLQRLLQRAIAGERSGLAVELQGALSARWQALADTAGRVLPRGRPDPAAAERQRRRRARQLAGGLARYRAPPYLGPITLLVSRAPATDAAAGWRSWLSIGRFRVVGVDAPADRLLARPETASALAAALQAPHAQSPQIQPPKIPPPTLPQE